MVTFLCICKLGAYLDSHSCLFPRGQLEITIVGNCNWTVHMYEFKGFIYFYQIQHFYKISYFNKNHSRRALTVLGVDHIPRPYP